jgi:hypothetical protein
MHESYKCHVELRGQVYSIHIKVVFHRKFKNGRWKRDAHVGGEIKKTKQVSAINLRVVFGGEYNWEGIAGSSGRAGDFFSAFVISPTLYLFLFFFLEGVFIIILLLC